MKVSPGVWYLQLAPGRSSELYVLKEDGDGSESKTLSKRITINDLRGRVVHLEVVKKKGKEHEKLLLSDVNDKTQDATEVSAYYQIRIIVLVPTFIVINLSVSACLYTYVGK